MVLYKPTAPGGWCSSRTLTQLVTTAQEVGFSVEYSTAPTTATCSTFVTLTL